MIKAELETIDEISYDILELNIITYLQDLVLEDCIGTENIREKYGFSQTEVLGFLCDEQAKRVINLKEILNKI